MPPSLKQSKRQGGCSLTYIPVDSLADSTFEQSENVAIAHVAQFKPAMSDVTYKLIIARFQQAVNLLRR